MVGSLIWNTWSSSNVTAYDHGVIHQLWVISLLARKLSQSVLSLQAAFSSLQGLSNSHTQQTICYLEHYQALFWFLTLLFNHTRDKLETTFKIL